MPRAAFPKGRKLLPAALAVAIVGGVWWWLRPPPEPRFEGTWLSEYLVEDFKRAGDAREPREQLQSYGPAGVAWLAYKLEHGRHPFNKDRPLPLDDAPDWLRRWFSERWGGLRGVTEIDERLAAANCLEMLGPDAAPAIPALARTMESKDPILVDSAADVFRNMGPVAWPAMREIPDHGSSHARIVLFDQLYEHFGPGPHYAPNQLPWPSDQADRYLPDGRDVEVALKAQLPSAVPTFIRAFHDSDPAVRAKAAYSLGDCKELRQDDDLCYDPVLPALIELLSDPSSVVSAEAIRTVGFFKARAASAIPRLIELLDDTDPAVRHRAAWALPLIDPTGRGYAARLRAMLADSDYNCQQAAKESLECLTLSPDEESAGREGIPAH